jgi:hypothetical protein
MALAPTRDSDWRAAFPIAASDGKRMYAQALTLTNSSGTEISMVEDQYEAVAASATDQVLGATGAAGDFIAQLIIQPATTAAGTVTLKDGTTVIFTFTTGTLSNLAPIIVPLGLTSINGAWKVTTGANVAALGCGRFT